uniref:Uncharacterized protein n=1 Tax=Tanacetum cinerariifolium TaxID=118510 RepID=A0A6L2N8R5_TANCI|nr:hypothetical protein [Tanacetum cinerariifolium]
MGTNDDEAGSSRTKRSRQYETIKENRCGEEIDGKLRKICVRLELMKKYSPLLHGLAFNINEPIYSELCHEFYSPYEFNEVCVDDDLKTKKIIKFRLGGHAHSLTLLEFAHRLGLYHAEELDEEGFDVYFQGGAGTQRDSLICCRQFITEIARKARVLSDEVLRSLSAPIYCRDLDTTTLRELIDSKGRLIPERMGSIEIRQGDTERMAYRQSYHWDRYAGVFEHMARVYNVPLYGAYNPPRYEQQQCDQYYQQYPSQQQQQQPDDE